MREPILPLARPYPLLGITLGSLAIGYLSLFSFRLISCGESSGLRVAEGTCAVCWHGKWHVRRNTSGSFAR